MDLEETANVVIDIELRGEETDNKLMSTLRFTIQGIVLIRLRIGITGEPFLIWL